MLTKTTSILLATATCFALAGCFGDGKAEGRLESVGGELGDWVLTKGTCYSGQRENYFGVLALGPAEAGTSLKLVKDPTQGMSLVVNIPSTCAKQAEQSDCRALVIRESRCDVFKARIERTNTIVNDIRKLDAHVEIDCHVAGGQLKGQLKYDGCH